MKVSDPKANPSGTFFYKIQGYDAKGYFINVLKRYNDFYELHDWLSFRFEGLYIPEIPPKKAIGNKDSKFVEERRLLLEMFLVNLTRHTYLR